MDIQNNNFPSNAWNLRLNRLNWFTFESPISAQLPQLPPGFFGPKSSTKLPSIDLFKAWDPHPNQPTSFFLETFHIEKWVKKLGSVVQVDSTNPSKIHPKSINIHPHHPTWKSCLWMLICSWSSKTRDTSWIHSRCRSAVAKFGFSRARVRPCITRPMSRRLHLGPARPNGCSRQPSWAQLPSGKHTKNDGKSPCLVFLMGKLR